MGSLLSKFYTEAYCIYCKFPITKKIKWSIHHHIHASCYFRIHEIIKSYPHHSRINELLEILSDKNIKIVEIGESDVINLNL